MLSDGSIDLSINFLTDPQNPKDLKTDLNGRMAAAKIVKVTRNDSQPRIIAPKPINCIVASLCKLDKSVSSPKLDKLDRPKLKKHSFDLKESKELKRSKQSGVKKPPPTPLVKRSFATATTIVAKPIKIAPPTTRNVVVRLAAPSAASGTTSVTGASAPTGLVAESTWVAGPAGPTTYANAVAAGLSDRWKSTNGQWSPSATNINYNHVANGNGNTIGNSGPQTWASIAGGTCGTYSTTNPSSTVGIQVSVLYSGQEQQWPSLQSLQHNQHGRQGQCKQCEAGYSIAEIGQPIGSSHQIQNFGFATTPATATATTPIFDSSPSTVASYCNQYPNAQDPTTSLVQPTGLAGPTGPVYQTRPLGSLRPLECHDPCCQLCWVVQPNSVVGPISSIGPTVKTPIGPNTEVCFPNAFEFGFDGLGNFHELGLEASTNKTDSNAPNHQRMDIRETIKHFLDKSTLDEKQECGRDNKLSHNARIDDLIQYLQSLKVAENTDWPRHSIWVAPTPMPIANSANSNSIAESCVPAWLR